MKQVLAEQRANNPEAKIAYHSMFDIASTDRDAFGVKLEHGVFFIPAFTSGEDGGQSQSITQSTLAGKLPANIFENSHCVVATWSVKWSPQGLGPVRPLVLFKQSCDLPAGKAVSLMRGGRCPSVICLVAVINVGCGSRCKCDPPMCGDLCLLSP